MLSFPLELVVLPHYYGKIIDAVSKSKIKDLYKNTIPIIIILIIIWLLTQFFYASMDFMDATMIPKLQSFIRGNVIKRIIHTFKSYYKVLDIGDITSRIVKLPFAIRDTTHQLRNFFIPTIIILIIAVCYFYYTHPYLGSVGFLGVIIFIFIIFLASRNCMKQSSKRDIKHNTLHEHIGDILNNLLPIYSANSDKFEFNNILNKQKELDTEYTSTIYCSLKFKILFNFMYLLFFFSVNGTAFYLYYHGYIRLDNLISVLIIVLYLISMLSTTAGEIRDFMFNVGIINMTQNYLTDLLNIPHSLQPVSNNFSIKNPGIRFTHVSFKYPTTNKIILKNISIYIPPKQIVAIVGPIGSGKSTFTKLILKFYYPSSGSIFINNFNLKSVNPDLLRQQIAYVPQNPILFNRTLFDNIVYGSNGINKNMVLNLIHTLKLKHIFNSFPKGIYTIAGKNGTNVSGGQRQIIFLLRCILRNNPIIILDEPTSALDDTNRSHIMNILSHLFINKTVFIISHDKHILSFVDRIISFKNGSIHYDKLVKSNK